MLDVAEAGSSSRPASMRPEACRKSLVHLLTATNRRSKLGDGDIGRTARRQLH